MAVVAGSEDVRRRSGEVSQRAPRNATWWLLGATILLGAVVRFTTLHQQSFWYDEGVTWGIVSHGLGHVLATVPKTESTPPVYYVLLWAWSRVFGTGEVGLRSLSALCSTLTIPVVWAIGRRLVSDRVGLVAALLTAVNPFLFWYAQEARSYSLLLLAASVSLLVLLRAVESPSRGRLAAWGVVAAVALAVHYYAAVVIAAEAAYLAVALQRRRRLTVTGAALAVAPVVVVGAALIPLLIRQNDGRAGYIATSEGPLPYRVAQLVKEDIIGQGQPAKALLTAVGLALVAAGIGLLVARCRTSERGAALRMLAIGGGGVLVAAAVSLVGTDYFDVRNLIATWPPLMLVVAIGLGCARAKRAGALATAGLVVLSLVCVWNIVSDPLFQRPDWRGAARVLGRPSLPRVIVSDANAQPPLEPYLARLAGYPSGTSVREVDVVWVQRAYQWGPLAPFAPGALPGFRLAAVRRTRTYAVLRYTAARPEVLPAAALDAVYPRPSLAVPLLQRP